MQKKKNPESCEKVNTSSKILYSPAPAQAQVTERFVRVLNPNLWILFSQSFLFFKLPPFLSLYYKLPSLFISFSQHISSRSLSLFLHLDVFLLLSQSNTENNTMQLDHHVTRGTTHDSRFFKTK